MEDMGVLWTWKCNCGVMGNQNGKELQKLGLEKGGNEMLWEIKMGTPKVGIRKGWTGRRGEKPSGLLLGGLDFMCRLFCQILIIIIECEIEQ